KGETRVAFDGDAVVVVKVNEIAESEVTGDGGGFGADAFFEIAVGADRVDVVIDRFERVITIEARRHHPRGQCHADAVRETLSERTGRHFDSGGVSVFGMSRSLRSPL